MGAPVDAALFADICRELQARGAENINIVTGSHAVEGIAAGLAEARKRGLAIPALWNSSAYETVDAIDAAADQIQVYLPDLKTLDSAVAARYFHAPDYPRRRQPPSCAWRRFGPSGMLPPGGPGRRSRQDDRPRFSFRGVGCAPVLRGT
jgi:putative pyruvate formate lyase activating enzyme